jgi:PAS domain S-box-containing protein
MEAFQSTPPTGSDPAGSSSLRVLIVDDVQENLELLEDILTEQGYASISARNGIEALEKLIQEPIHLIVADAMMPKMDGFQLCKEVRARQASAKVPFLIYTGNYVDEADQEFARSIGVDRYVVKYAGLGALVEAVNELAHEAYGRTPRTPVVEKEHIDDQAFLEKHHAIVIKKLEDKMAELEMYAETLIRKNREIQASEERYRALFDHASIPIFVVDRERARVLDVNREGIALLGYSRDEILAMHSLPFAPTSDFPNAILQTETYKSGEADLVTKSGTILTVNVGVGPVTRPQDPRVLLFLRDITDEKRLQDQLMQYEKMSIMGRLAAGIAHEIRNPLSAVSLNLQYLSQKYPNDAALRESLGDAIEGTKRVETVIENTLSLARVTPPVLKEEQINALVEQVSTFVKISIQQKDVRFQTEFAQNLHAVMADAKQIQQVILNVVQNAIDASPSGDTVALSTREEEIALEPGAPLVKTVTVAVRDHGQGIAPEDRKRLFEHFYTTKRGGTGLGLALSKQIMDRHNGAILIESADDGGTVVRLVFTNIAH